DIPGLIRQVLQGLLSEEVPVRDFERIAEALVETADGPGRDGQVRDVEKLLAAVRLRLGRFIATQAAGSEPSLRVAVLPPALEELAAKSVRTGRESGIGPEIEAETANHLRQAAMASSRAMRARGIKPVLVVQAAIRRAVARAIGGLMPVLALEEIPETLPLQVVHTAEPTPGAAATLNAGMVKAHV
ncbi:MAG: FHIPEP family type III secretion protein, partial [Acidocella sp.]|nr:FHIPEP family type III secretion protein [Acidocella sp.]